MDNVLEQRLRRLERSVRRLRVFAVVCLCAGGIAIFAAAVPQRRTIEAEAFMAVDARGKIRGYFGAPNGVPALLMTDRRGEKRVRLEVREGRANFELMNTMGVKTAQISAGPDPATVVLFTSKGKKKVEIKAAGDSPQITVFGANEKPRLSQFALSKQGKPVASGFSVLNAGKVRILLADVPGTGGVVRATNERGKKTFGGP